MEFEALLSRYQSKTCVISIELCEDGTYRNIRVAAGNQAHCAEMEALTHRRFEPDTPYDMWFPKNLNFEDHCFRCVTSGKPIHAYVNLYLMGLWLDMFLLPLQSDRDNVGYCIYCYDVAPKADSKSMADLSGEAATDVLNTCIKLRGANDVRQTFQEVIGDIRNICSAEQCCILLTDPEKKSCSVFCEDIRDGSGLQRMDSYANDDLYAITATWEKTLDGSTCIIVKDEHDMDNLRERNPAWAASLTEIGVQTIVLFPLRHSDQVLGYLWAVNYNVEEVVKIKNTLELTTYFLASELANYLLLQKMEYLSSIDTLTGIQNRNMMNHRVARIVAGQEEVPFAVIFADLNGLKRVNDEQGHNAGDQMLRSAAAILQGIFHDNEVYRAGGDEFMLIVNRITEDELHSRLEQVRIQSEKTQNVRFSVGVCCGEQDIRRAMRLADERMYADKDSYYQTHPELKYR